MHHISIGRAHKGVAVTLLIDDLDIRIVAAGTVEVLRAFALNPNIGYQPRFKKEQDPNPFGGSSLADVSRHHMRARGGT